VPIEYAIMNMQIYILERKMKFEEKLFLEKYRGMDSFLIEGKEYFVLSESNGYFDFSYYVERTA
jgi:hypothetical protein